VSGERNPETRLKVDGTTSVGMTTPPRVAVNARFACERHWLMNPTTRWAPLLGRNGTSIFLRLSSFILVCHIGVQIF
jgi:hypothetical protein